MAATVNFEDTIIIGNSVIDEERLGLIHENDTDIPRNDSIFIRVILYDTVCTTILPIDTTTPLREICNSLRQKIDISIQESVHYHLLLVISFLNNEKKCIAHCLRTILDGEYITAVKENLIKKIETINNIVSIKHNKASDTPLLNVTRVRWYYKDVRTAPLEIGDTGEIIGEYSLDHFSYIHSEPEKGTSESEPIHQDSGSKATTVHSSDSNIFLEALENSALPSAVTVSGGYEDGEFEISFSDLAYLTKAERKGYLLKRSNRDVNLWRRWFCVLTDHLWCVDVTKNRYPSAICLKLVSMSVSGPIKPTAVNGPISTANGKPQSSTRDKLQSILVTSLKEVHHFRAFNLNDQFNWIEDLTSKTSVVVDNDLFKMAEVIMCDDESSKTSRLEKAVLSYLESDVVLAAIASSGKTLNSRGVKDYSSLLMSVSPDVNSLPVSDRGFSFSSSRQLSFSKSEYDSRFQSLSEAHEDIKNENSITLDQNSRESAFAPPDIRPRFTSFSTLTVGNSFLGINSSHHHSCHPHEHPHYSHFKYSIHTLHLKHRKVAEVLAFLISVNRFKELFRHELFVSTDKQLACAVDIYHLYVQPQINLLRHLASLQHEGAAENNLSDSTCSRTTSNADLQFNSATGIVRVYLDADEDEYTDEGTSEANSSAKTMKNGSHHQSYRGSSKFTSSTHASSSTQWQFRGGPVYRHFRQRYSSRLKLDGTGTEIKSESSLSGAPARQHYIEVVDLGVCMDTLRAIQLTMQYVNEDNIRRRGKRENRSSSMSGKSLPPPSSVSPAVASPTASSSSFWSWYPSTTTASSIDKKVQSPAAESENSSTNQTKTVPFEDTGSVGLGNSSAIYIDDFSDSQSITQSVPFSTGYFSDIFDAALKEAQNSLQ